MPLFQLDRKDIIAAAFWIAEILLAKHHLAIYSICCCGFSETEHHAEVVMSIKMHFLGQHCNP